MADMGLGAAYGAQGAADALRSLVMDRLGQQQQAFNNDQAQQKLELLKQEAQQRLQTNAENSVQAAAGRIIAAHSVNDQLQPEEVQILHAAGLAPALVQDTTPTLPSVSQAGAVTTPSIGTAGTGVRTTATAPQPAQVVGDVTTTDNAGGPGGPVFRGTPAQRQVADQRQQLRGKLRMVNPASPMGQALTYRLLTGDNAPSGALTGGAAPAFQPKAVMVNGQRVMANYNPRTGTYADQDGQPLKNVEPDKADTSYGSAIGGLLAGADPKAIADGIQQGTLPPDPNSLNRYIAPAVVTELQKRGFNLAKAESDWKATQHYLGTLNGAGQVRLRQAVEFANDSLPKLQELSDEWSRGNFPPLNRAQLLAAKNGLLGTAAQQVATNLDNQLTELQSELAVVYRGGNAPTDQAFRSAANVLSSDWSAPQLASAIKLVQQNIGYRLNSIRNAGIVGSPDNAYGGQVGQQTGATGGANAPASAPSMGLSYQDYLNAKKKGGG